MARSFTASLDRVSTGAFTAPAAFSVAWWQTAGTDFRCNWRFRDDSLRGLNGGATETYFDAVWTISGFARYIATVANRTGWRHYCWVHDGTTSAPLCYQDGVSLTVTGGPTVGTRAVPTAALDLGGQNVANQQFGGSMGYVSMYNVVLTATEVLEAMRHGYVARGLVGYWPLTGDATEPDYSSLKRAGTVTGSTVVGGPPVAPYLPARSAVG